MARLVFALDHAAKDVSRDDIAEAIHEMLVHKISTKQLSATVVVETVRPGVFNLRISGEIAGTAAIFY